MIVSDEKESLTNNVIEYLIKFKINSTLLNLNGR